MSKGEAPMGRPIQKKWFGPGGEIIVTGAMFSDGVTATNAYILSQTGSAAYMVQDAAKTHKPEILFMVNAASTAALLPGQCFINATPFGGTALPAETIAQYRISLYNVPNTVPMVTGAPAVQSVSNYKWSTIPATKAGEADLITETATTGVVNAVTVGSGGTGYFTAPAVTFPAPGSGATATATVSAAGVVTGIAVTAGGSGYTAGAATVAAPPASVTATATITATAGAITAITLVNGGGFYTAAPAVTIGGPGTGATATATIAAGKVTGFTITAPGTGYTTATVSIAAPPAATTATATFTVTP
jgi:hypothetical protein